MDSELTPMTRVDVRLSDNGEFLLLDLFDERDARRTVSLPRAELGGLASRLLQLDRDVMNGLVVADGGPEGPG